MSDECCCEYAFRSFRTFNSYSRVSVRWQFECERRYSLGLFERRQRLAIMTFSFTTEANSHAPICRMSGKSNSVLNQKQREQLKTNRSLVQINTK